MNTDIGCAIQVRATDLLRHSGDDRTLVKGGSIKPRGYKTFFMLKLS